MAVLFLEPGGDADFGVALWPTLVNTPAVATDFVHGGHVKSIKYRTTTADEVQSSFAADAGGRFSVWLYFNALPNATASIFGTNQSGTSNNVIRVRMTSAGQLQIWNNTVQIGSSGSTLSTGVWYRLCLAWTITSTSVNQIRLFLSVAGAAATTDFSGTNLTLSLTGGVQTRLGNISGNSTLDMRSSDHYIDDSTALTDVGNVWVTAKRPVSNGTTNGFTTQIGSGGSGYGSGHSPQVNERALSTTNGWSMVGAGSAVTEQYTIEGKSVGDIDISAATIVDFMGWVDAKALTSETASIIVGGASSNISLTSTITIFRKVAGSTTYPAGGTDIGITTSTTVTTVSLYECGIVVAYIPNTTTTQTQTGKARITATTSQTQTGKARVTATAIQTQAGKSRIQQIVLKTQDGIARITGATARTQPATARVTGTTTRTQSALSRITGTTSKAQLGRARITATAAKLQTALARIQATSTKTQGGVSRIQISTSRTQTALARIQATSTQAQAGNARLQIVTSRTQAALARITAAVNRAILGLARITAIATRTQTGNARIQKIANATITGLGRMTGTTTRTQSGQAFISVVGFGSQDIFGKARIQVTMQRLQTALARIQVTSTQTQPGISRIQSIVSRTQSGRSRVTVTASRVQLGRSRMTVFATRTQAAISRITSIVSRTNTGKANIASAFTAQTISGRARIIGVALLHQPSASLRSINPSASLVKVDVMADVRSKIPVGSVGEY